MPTTRKDTVISLVGHVTPEICGNQLPSKKQVLQCYYYYTRHSVPKLSGREASRCIVQKCAIFWEYAGIPIMNRSDAATKMDELVKRHKTIGKYGSRKEKYDNYQIKEMEFRDDLDNLFDIAHYKAMSNIKNEAARELLSLHREKGRKGSLDKIIDSGEQIDSSSDENENQDMSQLQQVRSSEIIANGANYIFDDSEDIVELLERWEQIDDDEDKDSSYETESLAPKPKRIKIMNPDITAILDRAKISDRNAARVLAAVLMAAGSSLEDVDLSRETVRRNRRIHREKLSNMIRENSIEKMPNILTVHWDGKQLPTVEDKNQKVDRLPVLLSGYEWHQLLGVPACKRGTGELQSEAVHKCLQEWKASDKICAMVFDTTASNTGSFKGACVLLEKLLGRELLHLACRHHIFEILLKEAFATLMEDTSRPEVSIFKKFQGQWKNIDKEKFSPGICDIEVKKALHQNTADILTFSRMQLKKNTSRADYREFLELVIIFLGGNLERGNYFRALGPIHHARWMAKAIYSLKMYLFRNQFTLDAEQKSGLRDNCIFIVLLYQKAWFTASDAVTSPNNDLILLQQLAANANCSKGISSKICMAVLDKFLGQLWYLSEELTALAFFDENVSIDCKRKMCEAIKFRPAPNNDRKTRKTGISDINLIGKLTLDSFVNTNTMKFFEILKIDSGFLNSDPTTWKTRDDFVAAYKIVRSLNVTNDIAERAVAPVSEYNTLLTKDENSKQNLMLVVQKLRESSPNCTREDLTFSLQNYLNNNNEFVELPNNVN